MRALVLACATLALVPMFPNAVAEVRPIAMPGDTRLVRFTYDPNNTYTILTRPMSVSNIQLGDDEELVALAMGDTVQWVVTDSPGHVFVKPIAPDLVTSGTLVTTKRTYQLTFRSSPEDGMFYQQVTWHNPAVIALRQQQSVARDRAVLAQVQAREMAVQREERRLSDTVVSPGVSVENLNFDYTVSGKAAFAPTQVFDDGRFTWLRMPASQDMPAVFMLSDKGDAELLNFTIRDQYIVIQRLTPGILLKLGKQEVKVEPKRERTSWFGRSSRSGSNWEY